MIVPGVSAGLCWRGLVSELLREGGIIPYFSGFKAALALASVRRDVLLRA